MIRAIVYTTNTGSTKEYARILAEKTGLQYLSLEEAKQNLAKGTGIIYIGWIMASEIKGYKVARSRYKICAACAVGMGQTGTQITEVRNKTKIPEQIPVFTLQGGFDISKLSGIYKMMMGVMIKTAGKALAEKTDRTPDEDVMLEMMQHGGNHVCLENLSDVLKWYNSKVTV